jgi:RNA polymerase sigma-70 factor (ECF subfamily)
MSKADQTDIGGPSGVFQTTHWTEIRDAQSLEAEVSRMATERLLLEYWKPVYCYLRRSGYGNEDAKDLTQGFFEVALRRRLIQRAEQTKGKFRTFLLTALGRYVRNVHRNATTAKRQPSGELVSLKAIPSSDIPEAARNASPELAFHYTWACQLLDKVLAKVETQCRERGQLAHWEVFRARVMLPILDGTDAPCLAELCANYGIASEVKASNMIITIKRRLQAVLREHLQPTSGSTDVDDEIRGLMELVSRGRAG